MSTWRDVGNTVLMLLRWAFGLMKPVFRAFLLFSGGLLLIMVALACTRLPFDAHRALGLWGECTKAPKAIVVLGGSGMPSGPELLRLQHAAALAQVIADAPVMVVHPPDTGVMRLMIAELMLRGVPRGRIHPLLHGANTREQALAVRTAFPGLAGSSVALVTAPENMYRSVRTFRKVGFSAVCGEPAWDNPMFIDLDYAHRRIGGKVWVPDVSQDTGMRYTFWNYLKLEITCLREYAAIAYYWLNDWI
ncbi:MAG: YdcF family protein [Flavobacteriales bacterium]|nr:YdcF family protein [Flavobacteriales bacterium]MBK9287804.1 YdcF family protein [Flavobacteriales bacterium]MBL0035525.1 YdcF family protein [Flavobacteriales bacterium]